MTPMNSEYGKSIEDHEKSVEQSIIALSRRKLKLLEEVQKSTFTSNNFAIQSNDQSSRTNHAGHQLPVLH